MRVLISSIVAWSWLVLGPVTVGSAQEVKPPEGFTALFDGKSFEGWHGRNTIDPRKWADTPAESKAKWDKEIKEHWKIDNGTLINDGQGAYLSTNEEFGDIELLVDYKTVPLADSGIYLRVRPKSKSGTTPKKKSSSWVPTKAAVGCGITAPAPQARIHSSWPTSRSVSGTHSASFK